MKILVLQQDLISALSSVSRFVSLKPQILILSNILFSAEKGKLQLSATNLEMGISLGISAKIEREGKITIPARVILELINNIPIGQILIEENKGQVLITAHPFFSGTITSIPAAEFPNIPQKTNGSDIVFTKNNLSLITQQVCFAAANDETRPVLTGVLFSFGKNISIVATDGFRLSYREIKDYKEIQEDGLGKIGEIDKLLIPARLIGESVKVLGGFQGEDKINVGISKKEGQVVFSGDSVVLTGKLIEGEFPDFEKVLPKKWIHKALVGKEDLLRAVKIGAVFARESAGVIRLKIEKEKLVVFAENQQYGKEETTLDAKTEGEGVEVAFNYKYILEFLGSIKGEEVSFETEGPTSPGVFQDTKDLSYKHLIMPVRIQG